MPGIPREVIEHHLRIYPDATPVRQKPRKQSVERQNFIREVVHKLLHVGFIEEVHYPEWLANPVVVPKANGQLRKCIDYTYPLPRIDQIVDSTSGCDLLSFLDAYSGFHQIQISREHRKHTVFCNSGWTLLLYCHAMWSAECLTHVCASYEQNFL